MIRSVPKLYLLLWVLIHPEHSSAQAGLPTQTVIPTQAASEQDPSSHFLRVVVDSAAEHSTMFPDSLRLFVEGNEVPITRSQPPGAEDAALHALLFIDEVFVSPRDRDQALHQLRLSLSEMAPTDRLAVVAYDGTQLEVLAPWSPPGEEIFEALERAARRPAQGLLRRSERRRQEVLDRRRSRPPDADSFAGVGFSGSLRTRQVDLGDQDSLRDLARRSAAAAADALESQWQALGAPEGLGALLLVSGGWLPPGALSAECETFAAPLLLALERTGYAVYPVAAHPSNRPPFEAPAPDPLLLHLAVESGGQDSTVDRGALELALADAREHILLSFSLPTEPPQDEIGRGSLEIRSEVPDVLVRRIGTIWGGLNASETHPTVSRPRYDP